MSKKNPIQVTFRGVPHDDDVEAEVRTQIEHLPFDGIHGCRVVIGADERHHRAGWRYHVSIHLHLPGKELIAGKHPPRPEHTDALIAVRDSFKAVRRQLNEYVRKSQEEVRTPGIPEEPSW